MQKQTQRRSVRAPTIRSSLAQSTIRRGTHPNVDVNTVQDREKRKPPADAIDDGLLASLSKLINDGAAEKEMNDRPDAESVRGL